jgi:PhzF family phenazine biosynthesis protein
MINSSCAPSAEVWLVDAFASRPFAGNPAGVVFTDGEAALTWMQDVAAEMNCSETAFVSPLAGDSRYRLRWFAPRAEVEICGHATLAAAHVLWAERGVQASPLEFETKGGLLRAGQRGRLIVLDFPETPIVASASVDGLEAVVDSGTLIGLTGSSNWREKNALIAVSSAAELRGLTPNLGALAQLPIGGLIVTSPSDVDGIDFMSRYFAPLVGIDEDPVCGSAHCTLGPYWAERLGRAELCAYQASERGGELELTVAAGRVRMAGHAFTTLCGRITQDS